MDKKATDAQLEVQQDVKYSIEKFFGWANVYYRKNGYDVGWDEEEIKKISLNNQLPNDMSFVKCSECDHIIPYLTKPRLKDNDWYGQPTYKNAKQGIDIHTKLKHKK